MTVPSAGGDAAARAPDGAPRPARPALLAHRGDHRRAPENSLAALVAATQLDGVDGVEFDVRLSRDGVPVVIHDETLLRVQGDPRRVAELRAVDLERLGVPPLAEALLALPRRVFLDVELKEDVGRAGIEALASGRGPSLERAVISSFDPSALRQVRSLAPAWPCWLNTVELDEAVLQSAAQLGCVGIAAHWRAIRPATARVARDAGLELAAWTVTRRPTLERLARLGVLAVCVEGAALLAA